MSHHDERHKSTRPRRILRVLVPALIILTWFAAASIGGPYFGRVDEVSSNDQTSYLPSNADATLVQNRLGEFTDREAIPAIVVATSETTLTDAQLATLGAAVAAASGLDGVLSDYSPLIPSADGKAAEAFLFVSAKAELSPTVAAIRADLAAATPAGVTVAVTGPAGFTADLVTAFAGIDGILLLAALGAVFLILLIVYRSALLPITVLLTSMFALCAALLSIWWLAKAGALTLNGQIQGILFILVIGAATDYSLLYTARYKEELRRHHDKLSATKAAWRGTIEPIAASGGTVIAGLLCLTASELGSNRSLGPVAAIGIAFAMIAALTLLPALLYAFGRGAYWPSHPRFDPERTEDIATHKGIYARVGRLVDAHPRRIWIGAAALLAVGLAFLPQLSADGVPQSAFVLGHSEARDGQEALAQHFPGGSGSPAYIITARDTLNDVAATVRANPGVSSVSVTAADSPTGTAVVTDSGIQSAIPGRQAPQPTVVDGDVLLQATLADQADSSAAQTTVRALRGELDGVAIIGGTTATSVDTIDASIHDRNVIIPLVLVVILFILMLLLRAVVAPLILVATTVLSFGAAMGVSALVFNHVFGFPGADPSVPLYGFVFLVALGIDYNIFLMSRVREETLAHGTREGILRGLAITGGVITSAGIVLAATFAALGVIPILFLAQLAFIVAFGVLLDTFVVRTLLVPALAFDIGPAIWWPSKLHKASSAM